MLFNNSWRGTGHHISSSNHRDVFLGKSPNLEKIALDVKKSTEALNLSNEEKNRLLLDYKKPNQNVLQAVEERINAQNAPTDTLNHAHTNAPKR